MTILEKLIPEGFNTSHVVVYLLHHTGMNAGNKRFNTSHVVVYL